MKNRYRNKQMQILCRRKRFSITDARRREIEISEKEAADLMAFLYEHFSELVISARQEPRA